MANPILQEQQTDVVWTSAGGDEVLTLTSLAHNAARQGEEHDFTATHAGRNRLQAELDFNAAPTAGEVVNVYWSSSADGTDYDGECTGADAVYAIADIPKLASRYVGSLICTNDTDPQIMSWDFFMPSRYGLPVLENQSGQALTNVGTDQIITVTPLIDEVQ